MNNLEHIRLFLFDSSTELKVKLFDPKSSEEDLGFLKVSLQISPITEHHSFEEQPLDRKQVCASPLCNPVNHGAVILVKQVKNTRQSWKSIVSITLLEGRGLPGMDQNGICL